MARRRGPLLPERSTEAYVLRCYDYGEADRIVVLVSPSEGRLEGMAKGARRFKSGSGAALDLLSRVKVTYHERPGRDLVSLTRLELVTSSFGLLSTPESLEVLSHVAELAQAVAKPGEPSELLVRLLRGVLEAAAAGDTGGGPADAVREPSADADRRLALLGLYFDVWVSRLEGYWPGLGVCVRCGKILTGARRVGVHSQGATCLACAAATREATVPLGAEAAALAERLFALPPREAARLDASRGAREDLARLAAAILTVHLDRELKTMPVPAALRRRVRGQAGR